MQQFLFWTHAKQIFICGKRMNRQPVLLKMSFERVIMPVFLKNNWSLLCFPSTWKRSSLPWDCAIPLAHSSRLFQFHAPCLEALSKRELEGRHRCVCSWPLRSGNLGDKLIWFYSAWRSLLQWAVYESEKGMTGWSKSHRNESTEKEYIRQSNQKN